MNFKKKAGLALALAAIFTTGGANIALADNNITNPSDNKSGDIVGIDIAPDSSGKLVTITGTLVAENHVVVQEGVKVVPVEDLTILGDGGNLLVDAAGNPVETLQVVNNGDLQLGDSSATNPNAQGGSLKQVALDATNGASVYVTGGGNFDIEELTTIAPGTGQIFIEVSGDSTQNAVPTLTVGTLDLSGSDDATVYVGNTANGAGALVVTGTTSLGGNTIFADPAWNNNNRYEGSDVALSQFGLNTIDGMLIAGQNSRFAVNTSDKNWMLDIVKDMDTRFNNRWSNTDINAAFGIYSPIRLGDGATNIGGGVGVLSGGIFVDQTLTDAATANLPGGANTAVFADDSLLAVNMTDVTTANAALASNEPTNAPATGMTVVVGGAHTGALNAYQGVVGSQSSLYMANANTSGGYTLIGNVGSFSVNGGADLTNGITTNISLTGTEMGDHWTADNVMFSSDLLELDTMTLVYDATTGNHDLQVTAKRNNDSVRSHYAYLSNGIAGMVDQLYTNGANATEFGDGNGRSDNAGIVFVSRATDNLYFPDHKEAAKVLEGAAQIAVAAGVPTIANNIVNKFTSLIVDHASLLTETQPAYGNEPGQFGLWLTPFYQYSDVDGMDAGRFENGYEISYGGAAFGLDYNVNEAFRLGLALNVGGGDSESQGDFNKTENDFDFFGVSIYGTYTNGAFGLTGDIGYTAIDNEIDQKLPAAMGMGSKLRADVDSDAFTVGLTGEYRFVTGSNLNVTPHLGLRYTKISTDDANVKAAGRHVFKVDTEDQNLFQIPLGVKFSGDIITDGGWTVTPSADLGVLFTMGDTDVDSKARIVNTGFRGTTNSDVVDSAAFQGALGIKAKADNGLTLGLDYGILASGNQTDHSVSGLLRYEF